MTKIQLLQELIALVLRATMLPVIIRELHQRNRVTIIAYHRIAAPLFEKHLQYLLKQYSIISLEQFVMAKYQNCMEKLPAKSFVITFDDGARINHKLRDVLRKYHVPVTMFVCSDILGTNRHFWFGYRDKIKANLKAIPDAERLRLLSRIGFDEKTDYEVPEALSTEQTYDLLNSGVSIQSHTLTHPILPMCDDSKAEIEITKSRIDLENKFNIRVNCFAYPNGNYLPRDINFCKKAGYLAAVTMDPGLNGIDTDVYKLKRISICDNASINQLAVRASGLWNFVKGIFKLSIWGAKPPRLLPVKSGVSLD